MFDGETYFPQHDASRLSTQLGRVYELMRDGQWRTLDEIRFHCGGSEAAVSARLRDLRKERFGAHDVERKRLRGGLYVYRVMVRSEQLELIA